MSDLFSSLLHRHQGTCDVVKPRSRSRFETEATSSDIPFNRSEADEPGEENTASRALAARISVHPLPDTKDVHIKPLQIEVQENRPADQPLPLNTRDENHDHKPLIQPASDISPVEDIYERGIKPLTDKSVRGKREEASAGPAPVSRTEMVERYQEPMAEPKHRLDGNLDPQISAMLDRIENLGSVVSAPQEELYASERVPSTCEADSGNALDIPMRRPPQQAPMNDGAERADGPNTKGPIQPETASDHRDQQHGTRLDLPPWFSEIQAQSMLTRNRPDSEPPPKPVINVTIGRIEVKAAKMQAAPWVPQPQKPSGVMSLEKYLRQSERGGRR